MLEMLPVLVIAGLTLLALAIVILPSIHIIGPTEVGLIMKRFGSKLEGDNPIAFKGEAGYQAELLMPGFRFKLWLLYSVKEFPWVQIAAGKIGVVIAQIGKSLPIGAKSARYQTIFGNFTDLEGFVLHGGEKGVQRPVLPPGTLLPLHPVAFLVITDNGVYGLPISEALGSNPGPTAFGLQPHHLTVTRIDPQNEKETGKTTDVVGIVTTLEGDPLPPEYIAGRIGGFADIALAEATPGTSNAALVEGLLGSQNIRHNNYQDFQAFLDAGGRIGLQHDPLLYGAYTLNPFLLRVEIVPMLVVRQGEVAVIKAYVGLPTKDTSGSDFKFGSLVRPGHRGIWEEPLRTGKYPLNPRIYSAELVPTAIITLNWADMVSQAHQLDKGLKQIVAKSREGFVFAIDLQVQIHVPDTMAPRVISMVGTMQNLVNEVLQAAVGNHFRNKLQSMQAIQFIETRQEVQVQAFDHVRTELERYNIESRGVYIQDVVLPAELVSVLTTREIANQEIATYGKQQEAEVERIKMEKTKGEADMQAALSKSKVDVDIKGNIAEARKREGDGEAAYIRQIGEAEGKKLRAIGEGRAAGFEAQQKALGASNTALVNVMEGLAGVKVRFVPDVLVVGGGGSLEALIGSALQRFKGLGENAKPVVINGGETVPGKIGGARQTT